MSDFFGWGDSVESDAREFITLAPGKYIATVTDVKKITWDKAGKMNGCKVAEVHVEVKTDDDKLATMTDNLFLARSLEWKIGQYLAAFGLKKKGEPVRVEKIDKTIKQKVKITVGAKYDKNHEYAEITNEQDFIAAINAGDQVYNFVKAYEPLETAKSEPKDDEFGF